jgi:hypothetical protein
MSNHCVFNGGTTLNVGSTVNLTVTDCTFNTQPSSVVLNHGNTQNLFEINSEQGPLLTITKDKELIVSEELLHYGTVIAKVENSLPIAADDMHKLNPNWRMEVVKAIIRKALEGNLSV